MKEPLRDAIKNLASAYPKPDVEPKPDSRPAEASVSDKERADEVWEKAFMHWRRGEYRKRLPADIIASALAAVRVEATQSIIKKLRTALEKSHAHSASLMAFDDAARILTQDTERL